MAKQTFKNASAFQFSVIILSIFLIPTVLPANILFFFPGGNVSHKIAVWPWVLELAKRGHSITFISPHVKTPIPHPNITDEASTALIGMVKTIYHVDRFKDRDDGTEKNFDYNLMALKTCEVLIGNRETDPVLRAMFYNSSYDLIINNEFFGECGHFVAHYLKAKTIAFDSSTYITWYYDTYGVSPEAAYIPDLIIKFDSVPLNLWDRAINNLMTLYWTYSRVKLSADLQRVVKPLFPKEELPSLFELENKVSLVFINSHVSADFARSLPPVFVDVGGMASTTQAKELPQNFRTFMDGATDGVVLISFGSTVLLNAVSTRHQAMFFHLIHEFPNVRFIMRWSGPLPKFLYAAPDNLMVSEWLPQKEILSHPNIKLFITHGGVSSVQEATYHGVPLIALPLFADQDYNSYRIHAQEVGMKVEIRGMTGESLVNAVDKVLKDEKYKRNMRRKQAIFRDRPMPPVETAVFWTEFALRHEETTSTFRPMNLHLNWFQRRLLDVYLLYAGIVFLLSSLSYYILKFALSFIFLRKGEEEVKIARKVVNQRIATKIASKKVK